MISTTTMIAWGLATVMTLSSCYGKAEEEAQDVQIAQTTNISLAADESILIPYDQGFLRMEDQKLIYFTTTDVTGSQFTELGQDFDVAQAYDLNGLTVVIGTQGQLYYGRDGQWSQGTLPQVSGVVDMTYFDGNYMLVSEDVVASSTDLANWEMWSAGLSEPIISMDASDVLCIMVTENGEMLFTDDAKSWKMMDFCDYYSENVTFVEANGYGYGVFMLAYYTKSGLPVLKTAQTGLAWSERMATVDYSADPDFNVYDMTVNDVIWDGSQFMILCDDGWIITLPDCEDCNLATQIGTENWAKGLCDGTNLVLLTDQGEIEIINTAAVRQTDISVDTTYEYLLDGVPLIDVRDAEEYEACHITGSVNIPLSTIEEQLELLYPDYTQTLVFYCTMGAKSQEAIEFALERGYTDVYNMGSIDDWTYELTYQ